MAVVIETTLGDLTVDLFTDQRPLTCLNFLKLCKMKYYNFNLFHTIQHGFIAQTGDPTGEGTAGQSIWGVIEGPDKRYFEAEKIPKIKHSDPGLISMVANDEGMIGSQFFFTLASDLNSLDMKHCVIGQVTEGHEVLRLMNETICDSSHRPYQDVRITHTVILEDPFNDPKDFQEPSRSPSPSAERLAGGRIAPDEELDETKGKTEEEIVEMIQEKEAKARATILEIVGDLPDAEMAPPENVLFVCKLNPVTTDDDLEIIFSRFGKINCCEVIRDKKTGDSLQYAFIEFDNKKSCEDAYFKMDNVLIDDRRIHVDFSQSVSKIKWRGKGKGVIHLNDDEDRPRHDKDNSASFKDKGKTQNNDNRSQSRDDSSNYRRDKYRDNTSTDRNKRSYSEKHSRDTYIRERERNVHQENSYNRGKYNDDRRWRSKERYSYDDKNRRSSDFSRTNERENRQQNNHNSDHNRLKRTPDSSKRDYSSKLSSDTPKKQLMKNGESSKEPPKSGSRTEKYQKHQQSYNEEIKSKPLKDIKCGESSKTGRIDNAGTGRIDVSKPGRLDNTRKSDSLIEKSHKSKLIDSSVENSTNKKRKSNSDESSDDEPPNKKKKSIKVPKKEKSSSKKKAESSSSSSEYPEKPRSKKSKSKKKKKVVAKKKRKYSSSSSSSDSSNSSDDSSDSSTDVDKRVKKRKPSKSSKKRSKKKSRKCSSSSSSSSDSSSSSSDDSSSSSDSSDSGHERSRKKSKNKKSVREKLLKKKSKK